ncbi:MAG: hypothetical protein U0797_26150 [Gemmataceae bacterium]
MATGAGNRYGEKEGMAKGAGVMTEAEWRSSKEPAPLLTYLKEHASDRKVRLLACACCRLIWEHLPDLRSRQGIEVAERFADNLASPKDLAKAHNNALVAKGEAGWAVYWATSTKPAGPIDNVFDAAVAAPARHATQKTNKVGTWEEVQAETIHQLANLVREVVGNPFRKPWLSPDLLSWEGGLLVNLAQGIYHDRAFDRIPYLGDALEEAGCDDREVLDHCRAGGPHFRGCWVLDLVLGKE